GHVDECSFRAPSVPPRERDRRQCGCTAGEGRDSDSWALRVRRAPCGLPAPASRGTEIFEYSPSAVDNFRSHSPLRGSPGFTPSSLFRHTPHPSEQHPCREGHVYLPQL